MIKRYFRLYVKFFLNCKECLFRIGIYILDLMRYKYFVLIIYNYFVIKLFFYILESVIYRMKIGWGIKLD